MMAAIKQNVSVLARQLRHCLRKLGPLRFVGIWALGTQQRAVHACSYRAGIRPFIRYLSSCDRTFQSSAQRLT